MPYPWEPRAQIKIDIELRAQFVNWKSPEPRKYKAELITSLKLSNQKIDRFYRIQESREIDLLSFRALCNGASGAHCLYRGAPWYEDGDHVVVTASYEDPRFIRWESHGLNLSDTDRTIPVPNVIYFVKRDLYDSASNVIAELRNLKTVLHGIFDCRALEKLDKQTDNPI